jgi:hypothetical protein
MVAEAKGKNAQAVYQKIRDVGQQGTKANEDAQILIVAARRFYTKEADDLRGYAKDAKNDLELKRKLLASKYREERKEVKERAEIGDVTPERLAANLKHINEKYRLRFRALNGAGRKAVATYKTKADDMDKRAGQCADLRADLRYVIEMLEVGVNPALREAEKSGKADRLSAETGELAPDAKKVANGIKTLVIPAVKTDAERKKGFWERREANQLVKKAEDVQSTYQNLSNNITAASLALGQKARAKKEGAYYPASA